VPVQARVVSRPQGTQRVFLLRRQIAAGIAFGASGGDIALTMSESTDDRQPSRDGDGSSARRLHHR
jgi:hypothetical protein